jgi:hypothetical protein
MKYSTASFFVIIVMAFTPTASAKWMGCSSTGIAYTADTLLGPWTAAGGCADAPWLIQYRIASPHGKRKITIVKKTSGSVPTSLERQSASETFRKPLNIDAWAARLQEKGKP